MIIYLYVKTHSKTGLKYLGKTTKDPNTYTGSGIDWKAHLKEHGPDHTTEVICECTSKEELSEQGRYYSRLWNVVESTDWANRIPETGGGWCTESARKKISAKLKGKKKPPRTAEHNLNASNAQRGTTKTRTTEHQESWIASSKANWANNIERKKKVSDLGKSNKGRKHSPESSEKKRQAMLRYWELKRSQAS